MAPMAFTNSSLVVLCAPRELQRTYFRMCPDPDAYRFGILRMTSSIYVEMWVLAFGVKP